MPSAAAKTGVPDAFTNSTPRCGSRVPLAVDPYGYVRSTESSAGGLTGRWRVKCPALRQKSTVNGSHGTGVVVGERSIGVGIGVKVGVEVGIDWKVGDATVDKVCGVGTGVQAARPIRNMRILDN